MSARAATAAPPVDPEESDATPAEPVKGDEPPRWRRRIGPALALLAIVVFIAGTVGPPLFGRGVFLGHDLIYVSHPWKATRDTTELNVYHHGPVSDSVDAGYPAKANFAEHFKDGEYLTWNPWVGGGIPYAPSTSGVMSPFAVFYLLVPTWFAPALVKALQLAVAVGFTFLFCRRIGVDRGPSVFAGIAYAGSGFMVTWSNWEQTDVAAVIPALFWAAEWFIQKRTVTSLVPLALGVAAMMLGFFPAIIFYALYVLVPYVVVRVLATRGVTWWHRTTGASGVGVGLLAGVGLTAFAALPFATRLIDSGAADRRQNPLNNLGIINLATTVAPKALGLSTEGPGLGFDGPGNQVESISFVGMTTALLAIIAVALGHGSKVPRGVVAVFAVATLVLGAATYGGGPLLELLQKLPAFNNSNVARTRSILGFTVAILAGLGAQALVERRWPRSRWAWAWTAVVVGSALLGGAFVLRRLHLRVPRPGYATNLREALLLPVIVGIAAVVCLVAMRSARASVRNGAVGAIVGLLLVESLSFSLPLLPNESRDTLYPATDGIEYLQANVGEERLAAEGRTFFGNSAMLFGLRSVGVHAFMQPTWKEALVRVDATGWMSHTFLALHGTPEVVQSPILDRLGTGWWVSQPDHAPLGAREPAGLSAASCESPVSLGDASRPVDVPEGAAIRGVVVEVCEDRRLADEAAVVGTLGPASGRVPLPTGVRAGELSIPLPDGETGGTVELSLNDAAGQRITLASTPGGDVAFDVIRADDDGLRLAFADDLVVYERESALPRVRWASRVEVITDEEERLTTLASGELDDDTVVLSERSGSGSGDGEPARLTVEEDAAETIRLRVDAEGDGFVVVADALQNDWKVEVDGEPAQLEQADHAVVGVAVPKGEHDLVLRYAPRRADLGSAISLATLVVIIAGVAGDQYRRRRRHVPATE